MPRTSRHPALELLDLPNPTVAERAFFELARKYEVLVRIGGPDRRGPQDGRYDVAQACLILAVEWGRDFMGLAEDLAQVNARPPISETWMEVLPWKLCLVPAPNDLPGKSAAVTMLMSNLTHGTSFIRVWMMDIAWIVRSWLDVDETMPLLLTNMADTLGGFSEAAGLASALVPTAAEFFARADAFTPPPKFEEQYSNRLAIMKEQGIHLFQASFLRDEARRRRAIEAAVLGERLV